MRLPDERLDPVRRFWPPRGGALLRGAAVAGLLVLAALLVYTEPDPAGVAAACPVPVDELAVPAGLVGVPVGLADPAALAVLRAGDRVDLVPVGAGPAVARDALVLQAAEGDAAPVVYLAVTETEAQRVLGVAAEVRFRVLVRPG